MGKIFQKMMNFSVMAMLLSMRRHMLETFMTSVLSVDCSRCKKRCRTQCSAWKKPWMPYWRQRVRARYTSRMWQVSRIHTWERTVFHPWTRQSARHLRKLCSSLCWMRWAVWQRMQWSVRCLLITWWPNMDWNVMLSWLAEMQRKRQTRSSGKSWPKPSEL